MILDASAIVSIVVEESGHEVLASRVLKSSFVGVGGPTLLEALIVLTRKIKRDFTEDLQDLIQSAGIQIIPFGPEHFEAARERSSDLERVVIPPLSILAIVYPMLLRQWRVCPFYMLEMISGKRTSSPRSSPAAS